MLKLPPPEFESPHVGTLEALRAGRGDEAKDVES
jgi:hypothetical protein